MKKRFNLDLVEPRKRILKFWTFARNGQFTETGEEETKPEVLEKPLKMGLFEQLKHVLGVLKGAGLDYAEKPRGLYAGNGPKGHFRLTYIIDIKFLLPKHVLRPPKPQITRFNCSNRSILSDSLLTSG